MATDNHIRNPIEWGWHQFKHARLALDSAAHAVHGDDRLAASQPISIRHISPPDIREALRRGLDDFGECRTDVIFLCLLYPIVGLILAKLAFGRDMLPLIFPLASGFALIGPIAAMGLYEMSRRREQGRDIAWADAFGVVFSPAFGAIIVLSLILLGIFLFWLAAAWVIYAVTLGPAPPETLVAFLSDVFTTPAGWTMIAVGIGVGFLFAVVVFVISVVSFPLLLDRDVGLRTAVAASVQAVQTNPRTMTLWGLVVVGGLVVGSIPLLIGLAIVLPVLGHATWHLYRRVIEK